jgi:ABC-type oligopeptide transport system substrate-binding subunit
MIMFVCNTYTFGGQFSNLESSYRLKRIEYWGKENPVEKQGLFVFHDQQQGINVDTITKTSTVEERYESDDILSYLNT